MRHFTLLITSLFSLSLAAGEPAEIAFPVLVKDSDNGARAGFISAEVSPQNAAPNALSRNASSSKIC
jgi:hypothetical protein